MNRRVVSFGVAAVCFAAHSLGYAQPAPAAPAADPAAPAAPAGAGSSGKVDEANPWVTPAPASASGNAAGPGQASPKASQHASSGASGAGKGAAPSPLVAPTPAPQTVAPAPPRVSQWSPVPPEEFGYHQRNLMVQAGLRMSYIQHSGYNLFGKTNTLPQFSLGVGAVLTHQRRTSLAIFGGWDLGGNSATARAAETSLFSHRIWVAPEFRFHVLPALYVYARPALGAVATSTSLVDSSADIRLYASGWAASFEATAGVAAQVFGEGNGALRRGRAWVIADGGYGWTGPLALQMEPDAGEGPSRTAPLDLGSLVLRGPQFRLMAAVTY